MARSKRSAKLDSRSARLKLPSEKNHMEQLTKGLYLNYRIPKNRAAGTWTVCFLLPGTNQQRRIRLGAADDYADADGKTFLNYSQAQTKATELFQTESRQARGGNTGRKGINVLGFTVADALQFLWDRKENLGEHVKGLELDKLRARTWIIPELGHIPLTELTKDFIESWLGNMAKSGRRTNKINPATGEPFGYGPKPRTADEKRARKVSANRVLAILKKALNEAYREIDILAESNLIRPCWQRVKPLKAETKKRPGCLTEKEETRLINVCPLDFRELVIAALETGCRYGELAQLRVKDYVSDPQNSAIYIEESKSGKPRYVPLGSNRGVALFEELTAKKQSPDDFIFTHFVRRNTNRDKDNKCPIVEDTWRHSDQKQLMRTACIRAGIDPPVGFHQLRHTFTERLLRKGVQRRYVADVLGHRDTRMLDKHYEHIRDDDKAEAIRAAMAGRERLDEPKFQS